jgi:hypothetical protein
MAISPATTRKLNQALRASYLPEAKVTERYPNGKARQRANGWQIEKQNDFITVWHTGLIAHIDRDAGQQFAEQITQILANTGLHVEIVIGITRHSLTNVEREYVQQIRVSEKAY